MSEQIQIRVIINKTESRARVNKESQRLGKWRHRVLCILHKVLMCLESFYACAMIASDQEQLHVIIISPSCVVRV